MDQRQHKRLALDHLNMRGAADHVSYRLVLYFEVDIQSVQARAVKRAKQVFSHSQVHFPVLALLLKSLAAHLHPGRVERRVTVLERANQYHKLEVAHALLLRQFE